MSPEDTLKIAAIVQDYRTRAYDANIYIELMETRLAWLEHWLKRIKTLTLLVPVLLTASFAEVKVPKPLETAWHLLLSVAAIGVAALVAISYGRDWDAQAADLRSLIELLRVQQLGFQRQGAVVHDNANNIAYTHRLETERHDILMGRIQKYVSLQAFRDRAKALKDAATSAA